VLGLSPKFFRNPIEHLVHALIESDHIGNMSFDQCIIWLLGKLQLIAVARNLLGMVVAWVDVRFVQESLLLVAVELVGSHGDVSVVVDVGHPVVGALREHEQQAVANTLDVVSSTLIGLIVGSDAGKVESALELGVAHGDVLAGLGVTPVDGRAEVRDVNAVVFHHEVGRLDVSVQRAHVVHLLDAVHHLQPYFANRQILLQARRHRRDVQIKRVWQQLHEDVHELSADLATPPEPRDPIKLAGLVLAEEDSLDDEEVVVLRFVDLGGILDAGPGVDVLADPALAAETQFAHELVLFYEPLVVVVFKDRWELELGHPCRHVLWLGRLSFYHLY